MKFHIECRQNHVWGPPGARVMSIFIKTYIFVKVRERKGRTKGKEREKGKNGREGKGFLVWILGLCIGLGLHVKFRSNV